MFLFAFNPLSHVFGETVLRYGSLWQAVDAIDNGINQYDVDQPPRYVNATGLSYRVARLNLDWVDPDQSSERENAAFWQAMTLAGSEFLEVQFSSVMVIFFHEAFFSSGKFFPCGFQKRWSLKVLIMVMLMKIILTGYSFSCKILATRSIYCYGVSSSKIWWRNHCVRKILPCE